jgi:hypothetical protein
MVKLNKYVYIGTIDKIRFISTGGDLNAAGYEMLKCE